MIILVAALVVLVILLLQKNNTEIAPPKPKSEKTDTPNGENTYVDNYEDVKQWEDCWSGTPWESEYQCYSKYVVGENKGLAVSGDDFCKNDDKGLSGLWHQLNGVRWSIRPGSECVSQYVNDGEVAEDNVTCSTIVNKPTRYVCKDNGKKNTFQSLPLFTTSWSDSGVGKNIYLDRHKASCSKGAGLRYVHMKDKDSQIRYEYKCTKPTTGNSRQTGDSRFTDWADNGRPHNDNGKLYHLGDIKVQCKPNEIVSELQLKSSGNNIKYDYKCLPIDDKMTCSLRETSTRESNKNRTSNLHDLDTMCNEDEAMQSYHITKEGNYYKLKKNCCKIE